MGLNSKILGFVETSIDDFDIDVLESRGLTLVEFYRHGCQSCDDFEPILEQFADFNLNRCKMVRQAVTGLPGDYWTHRFPEILGEPTCILFLDGEAIGHHVGNFPKLEYMVHTFNGVINKAMIDPNNGAKWASKLIGTRFAAEGRSCLEMTRLGSHPKVD